MNAPIGARGCQGPFDHPVPVERRDPREGLRPHEHLQVVHGAGEVVDLDGGVGHGFAQQSGNHGVDHERRVYDPGRPRTRQALQSIFRKPRYVRLDMRTSTRARTIALALLAAVAGSASVGVAALARAGFCLHRIGLFGLHPSEGHADLGAPASALGAAFEMHAGAPCPILVGIAIFGAVCYLVAVVALVALRPSIREFALTSAHVVSGARLAPLTVVIALLGAVPVGAVVVADGMPTPAGLALATVFLSAAALVVAAVLIAASHFVIACARRFVNALLATQRMPVPRSDGPLRTRRALAPVAAGVLVARRRPSRAPPVRGCS